MPLPTKKQAELVEQTTTEYRHDWEGVSEDDRQTVRAALLRTYELLQRDRRAFYVKVQRPFAINLKAGLAASLYSLRVARNIRIILAVDDGRRL